MGAKENFNQAMQEVFPFYKNAKGTGAGSSSSNLAEQLDGQPAGVKAKEPIDFQAYDPQKHESIETTRITKDTKITGKITSKSNLDIGGDVFGDVDGQNGVKISGRIEGNVNGKSVELNHAVIKGNVHAGEGLLITNQSELLGDVSASELELNSTVNGNISVKRVISIQKDSKVMGDITAMSIDIEKGAIIKGMVNVTGERKGADDEDPV